MKLDKLDNIISMKIVKITKKGEDRNITKKKDILFNIIIKLFIKYNFLNMLL